MVPTGPGKAARKQHMGISAGEVTGQVLEVRSEDLGVERRCCRLPHLLGEARFHGGGLRHGDELVEADHGVRERYHRVAGAQNVLLAPDVAGRLQDAQRVLDGVAGRSSAAPILLGGRGVLGDGGEEVVVQGVLGDPGGFAQPALLPDRSDVQTTDPLRQRLKEKALPCRRRPDTMPSRVAGSGSVTNSASRSHSRPDRPRHSA